jgi:perosamine synthetase
LANAHGLPVVEDAACALGAEWNGRPAGSWGRTGCFSLHPRKAITTGEGGFITTSDSSIARRVRGLRNHGLDPEVPGEFIEPGYNYRMTDFQAALGVTQLAKLARIIEARRKAAARYDALLANQAITPPKIRPEAIPVFQTYVATLPGEAACHRAAVIEILKERGIEANIGTIHIPLTRYYRDKYGYQVNDFPMTDEVFSRSLALPLHEYLTPEDQTKVAEEIMAATATCVESEGRQ